MPRRKPEVVLFPARKIRISVPGVSEDDFDIFSTYHTNGGGLFNATLKVVRKTDGRACTSSELQLVLTWTR
jgi:hypothetical protein